MRYRADEDCISLVMLVAALNDVAQGRETLHSVLAKLTLLGKTPRQILEEARRCVEECRSEEELKREFRDLLRRLERVLDLLPRLN